MELPNVLEIEALRRFHRNQYDFDQVPVHVLRLVHDFHDAVDAGRNVVVSHYERILGSFVCVRTLFARVHSIAPIQQVSSKVCDTCVL